MSAVPGPPTTTPAAPVFVNANDPRAGLVVGPERWIVAPLRNRSAAFIADLVIIFALSLVATLPFWAIDHDAWPGSSDSGLLADLTSSSTTSVVVINALCTAVSLVVWLVYVAVSSGRAGEHHGQTFGKQLFDVRVLRANGDPLERGETWARAAFWPIWLLGLSVLACVVDLIFATTPTFSNIVSVLEVVVMIIVMLIAFARRDRRGPHDQWYDTVVVQERPIGHRDPAAPIPRSGELPIEDRGRTWDSWLLMLIALGALVLIAI